MHFNSFNRFCHKFLFSTTFCFLHSLCSCNREGPENVEIITARNKVGARLCFYTSVILFTGWGWYPSIHCRWYPSMPCSRSPGGGIPACLPGLQAHTQGGSWGVWPGGSQGPHLGGSPGPHLGRCVSQHALRQTPPPMDGYYHRRYASYWNAFLLLKLFVHLNENCIIYNIPPIGNQRPLKRSIFFNERTKKIPNWVMNYRHYATELFTPRTISLQSSTLESVFTKFRISGILWPTHLSSRQVCSKA